MVLLYGNNKALAKNGQMAKKTDLSYLRRMRIAVNTRFLLSGKMEGFGWYTYETLRRITTAHPEHEFIFLFDRTYDPRFVFSSNVTPVVIAPQARHPFLFWIWFECSVRRALKKYKADVFVSPDGYLSLRSKIPSLAVIHDLNFEHYPGDLSWLVQNYYRYFFPRFAKKADRIVTVSHFSSGDIQKQYGIAPEKIDVVYNGVNESLQPVPESQQSAIRKKYTDGNPYFVFIGALHPRKNLARMFRAYDQFRSTTTYPHKLLLIGEKYLWNKEIAKAYTSMQHKNDVVFTGHLSMEDLHLVLGSAFSLLYVSVFEGFGLPVVEAMKCEIPVITSNCTSLPEVAGDAALLCNPFSIDAIAAAMEKMCSDPELRSSCIEKGKINCERFSWKNSAEGLWNSILQLKHA